MEGGYATATCKRHQSKLQNYRLKSVRKILGPGNVERHAPDPAHFYAKGDFMVTKMMKWAMGAAWFIFCTAVRYSVGLFVAWALLILILGKKLR